MRTMTVMAATGMVAMMACAAAQVQKPGGDVTMPRLVREVKPEYTAAARKERVQGSVLLEMVVKEDGTVGEARITQSLDTKYGLDEQAIKAAKQWEFKPGMKNGKAVPVQVDIEMTFTLK